MAILDRPIAFHPNLARLVGGVNAGLLLGQAIYWSRRTRDPGGWFYKTQGEWEEETALGRFEQEAARKKLVKFGVLEEVRKGVPARLFFRVNTSILADILTNALQNSSLLETSKLDCGKVADKDAGNQQTRLLVSRNQDCCKPADYYNDYNNDYQTTTTTAPCSQNWRNEGVVVEEAIKLFSVARASRQGVVDQKALLAWALRQSGLSPGSITPEDVQWAEEESKRLGLASPQSKAMSDDAWAALPENRGRTKGKNTEEVKQMRRSSQSSVSN